MPRFPAHLHGHGPINPFPGVRVLERRLGHPLAHRLGSNEGLDMPHAALRARFGDALAGEAYGYGDAEALGIRERLRDQHGIALEHSLVDAGADSLIALALRTTCVAGMTVVATKGTYPTFGYLAAGMGCQVIGVSYRQGFQQLAPDLDALCDAAHANRAQLVYLANPDNPSGHLHTDNAIRALREHLPSDCWLLLDEAYADFRDDPDTASLSDARPGVIRVRTFSKAHGLAGLRLGYAIATTDVLDIMMKVRIHYAVSSLTQAAAETVLDHPDEVAAHVKAVKARRQRLAAQLEAAGGEVLPSTTNFVGVRLASAELAGDVHQALLAEGTLIARAAHPDIANLLRVTALEDALAPGRLATLENALSAS